LASFSSFEQLRHRFVVQNEDRVLQNLRGQVEIAGLPCHQRGLGRIRQGNPVNHLRELADDVVVSILLENHPAVRKAFFQIESELGPVFRDPPPTAFEKLPPLGAQRHLPHGRQVGFAEKHALDQVHSGCRIGSGHLPHR